MLCRFFRSIREFRTPILIGLGILLAGAISSSIMLSNGPGRGPLKSGRISDNASSRKNAEFAILELPPNGVNLDHDISGKIWSILDEPIFKQDVTSSVPTALAHYGVKYIIFYDRGHEDILKPFLKRNATVDAAAAIAEIDGGKLGNAPQWPFFVQEDGWYDTEGNKDSGYFSWMKGDNATISLYVPTGTLQNAPRMLKFSAQYAHEGTSALSVLLNGTLLDAPHFSGTIAEGYAFLDGLREGENHIKFIAKDGCKTPKGSNDNRCLSFALQNIGSAREEEVPQNGIVSFDGFFPEETAGEGTGRWMGRDADLHFFMRDPEKAYVEFEAASYAKKRDLSIAVNGSDAQPYAVDAGNTMFKKIQVPLQLRRGNNFIELKTGSCDIPSSVERKKDKRCLGVMMRNFQFKVLR